MARAQHPEDMSRSSWEDQADPYPSGPDCPGTVPEVPPPAGAETGPETGTDAGPGARFGSCFRPYFQAVSTLLTIGAAAMGLLPFLGIGNGPYVPSFLWAALLGLLGLGAWAVVSASRARPGSRPGLAWAAFPISILCLAGMLPLLASAAFPGAMELLGSPDRLTVRRLGGALEIEFPRLARAGSINLELGDAAVPPRYFDEHPQRARWRHVNGLRPRSVLWVDLEGLRADLRLPPADRVGINRIVGAPPMVDEEGQRFQPQRIPLEEPPDRPPEAPGAPGR